MKNAVFCQEAGAGRIQSSSVFTKNTSILHTFLLEEEVNDPKIPHKMNIWSIISGIWFQF